MTRRHAGLLRRVTAMLRPDASPPRDEPGGRPPAPDGQTVAELRARVDALEALVEGLQDAVYRQSRHHDDRFEQLRRRIEPDELARALSADARRRGL